MFTEAFTAIIIIFALFIAVCVTSLIMTWLLKKSNDLGDSKGELSDFTSVLDVHMIRRADRIPRSASTILTQDLKDIFHL